MGLSLTALLGLILGRVTGSLVDLRVVVALGGLVDLLLAKGIQGRVVLPRIVVTLADLGWPVAVGTMVG